MSVDVQIGDIDRPWKLSAWLRADPEERVTIEAVCACGSARREFLQATGPRDRPLASEDAATEAIERLALRGLDLRINAATGAVRLVECYSCRERRLVTIEERIAGRLGLDIGATPGEFVAAVKRRVDQVGAFCDLAGRVGVEAGSPAWAQRTAANARAFVDLVVSQGREVERYADALDWIIGNAGDEGASGDIKRRAIAARHPKIERDMRSLDCGPFPFEPSRAPFSGPGHVAMIGEGPGYTFVGFDPMPSGGPVVVHISHDPGVAGGDPVEVEVEIVAPPGPDDVAVNAAIDRAEAEAPALVFGADVGPVKAAPTDVAVGMPDPAALAHFVEGLLNPRRKAKQRGGFRLTVEDLTEQVAQLEPSDQSSGARYLREQLAIAQSGRFVAPTPTLGCLGECGKLVSSVCDECGCCSACCVDAIHPDDLGARDPA